MILPFNKNWKCCETCNHWQGQRNSTPFGLLARREATSCHMHGTTALHNASMCQHYRQWETLDSAVEATAAFGF